MRELGLCATSAGSIRIVKRHVSGQGLDTSHFSGQWRWSDAQLRRAVASAYSWTELLSELGLNGNADDRIRIKAHAARLGLDLSRLYGSSTDEVGRPVSRPDIKQVQVKTTTFNNHGWLVRVGRRSYSVGNRGPLVPYDPDLVDLFFILDGDLTMYVIPSRVIAGLVAILLNDYSEYVVGSAAFLMKGSSTAA
jgi:hypothetical protein